MTYIHRFVLSFRCCDVRHVCKASGLSLQKAVQKLYNLEAPPYSALSVEAHFSILLLTFCYKSAPIIGYDTTRFSFDIFLRLQYNILVFSSSLEFADSLQSNIYRNVFCFRDFLRHKSVAEVSQCLALELEKSIQGCSLSGIYYSCCVLGWVRSGEIAKSEVS